MRARRCPRCERKGAFRKAAVIAGFLPVYVCRYCGYECGGKVEVVNYQAMRRDLQSIREIIEQLQEEDRRAEEWWKATLARLEKQQRKLAPKKKPLSAKPKQRKRVGLG